MITRGQGYVNLIGGQNLNVQDLINNNQDKTLERINIVCDTTNGLPTTILLPEIANLSGFTNLELTITDSTNNASVGNINVIRGGATDRINQSTSATISTNSGKLYLQVASVKKGIIAAAWSAFLASTASAVPYVPPTQINQQVIADPSGVATLAHIPVNTQHVIVVQNALVLVAGVEYTVSYVTPTISGLAPGAEINVFYSY